MLHFAHDFAVRRGPRRSAVRGLCLAATLVALCATGRAEEARRAAETVDRTAKRLFDQAMELIEVKQFERGLAMLDTVIRDNAGSILGYRAHMAKGKHFLDQNKPKEALSHFMLLSRLLKPQPGEAQSEEVQQLYKESLFNSGLAHFQAGQYASSFPMFRRLTEIAGKSKWANQAYFYIGMSHYNLKNWNKAIDALSLVGTEVEDTGDETGRIEIGQRFYAKVTDEDIQILRKLKRDVKATVRVASGDRETLTGVPVAGKKNEMLLSAPTRIGRPNPGDGVLQMIGGDALTITYSDDSTLSGDKNVERSGTVKAVSTGTVGFYLGDLTTPAYIAYPGQPQPVLLRDADLDTSPRAESLTVTVKSMQKVAEDESENEEDDSMLDIFAAEDENKERWQERDSIVVKLVEQGDGPAIRSGLFAARVPLAAVEGGARVSPDDDVLHCDELDELVVEYEDEVHLYGEDARQNAARIKVSSKVRSGVDVDQHVVTEKVLKARKGSVEAEALKGLGLIYKDMGLEGRAVVKADEALKRVDGILIDRKLVPGDLVENAFRLKWENEFIKEDFKAAIATCQAFNRLYPESVLADQALMTLSRTLAERREYEEAIKTYAQVMSLKNPISAAEAQYRIGDVRETMAKEMAADAANSRWTADGEGTSPMARAMGPAIGAYAATYQRYPESPFAAMALEKVVRYHAENANYAQASDLLEKTFSEYPDAKFLDEMLYLWAEMGFQMGNRELAKQKLNELIFNYPSSKHAADAKKKLAALD